VGVNAARLCKSFSKVAKAVLRRDAARRRERLKEMKAAWRWFLPRRRQLETPDQNEVVPARPRRIGPMSLEELIAWHRANHTLKAFLKTLGR
jgi:hypothetical protein